MVARTQAQRSCLEVARDRPKSAIEVCRFSCAVPLKFWTVGIALNAIISPTNLARFESSLLKAHHGTLARDVGERHSAVFGGNES